MPDRPNILWLMTDEQRADSLSYTGTPWAHTPNLDAVALSGTRFTSAYTPSPVCVSARACLLTGRHGSSIGMLNNHHRLALEDPRFLTWAFAAGGYQVASFGKHHYNCPRQAFDVEGGRVLGDRVHYFEYTSLGESDDAGVVRYDGGESPWLFAGRYPGGVDDTPEMENVAQALAWIRRRDPSRPFLLRLSLNAPHTPVVTPAPFDTLVSLESIELPIDWSDDMAFASRTHQQYLCSYAGTHRLSEAQIRRSRQCYYGHVAFVDHVCGRLLNELAAMGELDNSLVAFVSDHGTHLGEHGFFQKQSFWDASARIPLFLDGPDICEQVLDAPVSSGSLLPTLLDLVGLPVPPQGEYASLAATVTGEDPPPSTPVFSEIDYGLWHYRSGDRRVMVRDGKWKLVLYRDPRDPDRFTSHDDRVLYDLVTDPGERINLAGAPACTAVEDRLLAALDNFDHGREMVEPSLVKRHR